MNKTPVFTRRVRYPGSARTVDEAHRAPAPRRQRGLALVTAMLIVAIVASLAASLSLGQQVWLRQAQNINDRAQADKVSQAGLQWALLFLLEDARKHPATDDLTEDWAKPLPPIAVEGGAMAGRISDAQGLFNLNSLLRAGNPSPPDIGVFRRLLQSLSLNDSLLIDSLMDWMDADADAKPAGAEDIYYLTLQPPYRAANQRLESVDELRLVKGYDAKTVELLRPYVSVLPEPTAVNVNTAGAPVLSALFAQLPQSTAQQLVEQREKNPFKDKNDLIARAGLPPETGVDIGVTSAYFYVHIDTLFGRLQRSRQALVHRAAGGIDTLWQVDVLGAPPAQQASTP
jgi:general secretion pathway protein K